MTIVSNTNAPKWPRPYIESLCEQMGNRLLQELDRLEAPPAVIDLAHGLDFMAAYLHEPARFENGFEDVLQRCICALIDTGGV